MAQKSAANDMRSAYMQGIREKAQIQSRGEYKGFSNDNVSDLMKLQPQGPLDHSNNDSRKDALNYKLDKLNSKITNNLEQMKYTQT